MVKPDEDQPRPISSDELLESDTIAQPSGPLPNRLILRLGQLARLNGQRVRDAIEFVGVLVAVILEPETDDHQLPVTPITGEGPRND